MVPHYWPECKTGGDTEFGYQNKNPHPKGWGYTDKARLRGLKPMPRTLFGWGYTNKARLRGLKPMPRTLFGWGYTNKARLRGLKPMPRTLFGWGYTNKARLRGLIQEIDFYQSDLV